MKYSEQRHPEACLTCRACRRSRRAVGRRTLGLISPAILALVIALATLFPPTTRADDDPAKALQTQFEAAKASLAAGDLASAESHYVDTIALGLRQLAQLSLSL